MPAEVPYTPPKYQLAAFNCPHCLAYARQAWKDVYVSGSGEGFTRLGNLRTAWCTHCGNYMIWHDEKMIYPEDSGVEPPNPDLSKAIRDDYLEARAIVNRSPRGAAALLRLSVQKLCQQLGEEGSNLNDDIARLVSKGLPVRVQQALDIVRVVGNNAVHPGVIDIRDDQSTAQGLFELINLIADAMITQPKQVEATFQSLPATAKNAIEQRDKGPATS